MAVRPSDYSQFVFLALCVFDFDIPGIGQSKSGFGNFHFIIEIVLGQIGTNEMGQVGTCSNSLQPKPYWPT